MDSPTNEIPEEDKAQQSQGVGSAELPQELTDNPVKMEPGIEPVKKPRKWTGFWGNIRRFWAIFALVTYIAGLGSGFLLWGRQAPASAEKQDQAGNSDVEEMVHQIYPEEGYKLPASYGDIGPKLVDAGAIDMDQFVKVYQEIGKPLSKEQVDILTKGSKKPVIINPDNQQFLLNLFWAFGLANQNRILTEGPMMRNGKDQVVNFASTGGWTIAAKPVIAIYASTPIVTITEEQQKRLEEVAQGVYRPCCDNPTHFPDCNHGMAMLGLLELMASQDATTDEMFQAAKYINAYWFPQQTFEVAIAFKSVEKVDFAQADARKVVGQSVSSGSGFQGVHQWLVQNGQLQQAPQSGGSCGVK